MAPRSLDRTRRLAALVLAGLLAMAAASSEAAQGKTAVDGIPKKVMDALKTKFPAAEIDKWTKEEEGGRQIYDIEFRQKGRKLEADIFADGTFHNWEREVAVKDLPAAVTETVARKYPKATIKEVMAITAVNDAKEILEGYEIVLVTAGKREIEVTVAPDGRILEEAGSGT